jgi:hypothetical protein
VKYSGLPFSGAVFLASGIFAIFASALHFDTTPLASAKNTTKASSVLRGGDERTSLSSSILLERPLFNSTRRPFEKPEAVPEPEPAVEQEMGMELVEEEPAPQPVFRLLGVAKINAGSIALVAEGDQGQARWLAIGDVIGDWTVSAVHRSTIILAHHFQNVAPMTVPMFARPPEDGEVEIE